MSDEAVVVSSAAPGDLTAGMLLRQAREATGLHIAALAVSMKVPVKKLEALEALEADRLQELPDAVFVRALAASVCRTLKVDPAPILNKLPQSVVPKLDSSDRGVSMPVQGSSFLASRSFLAFVSRPPVLMVAALLLAALAVLLFPEARNTVAAVGAIKTDAVAPEAKLAEPAPAPAVTEKPLPASPEAPVQAAAVAPEQAKAPAPLPAAAASPEASATANGLLVFKAKSRAWVRVSDSKGVVQFEKTLDAGESAAASGSLPLSVIVGNVAATEVELRGQPFPLDALNRNNVARFEVK